MADSNALPMVLLAEQFAKLPGIGMKSAQRLAYYLISRPEEEVQAFADAGREVVFVGDCNTKIGTLYHAVHTAHEAASVL